MFPSRHGGKGGGDSPGFPCAWAASFLLSCPWWKLERQRPRPRKTSSPSTTDGQPAGATTLRAKAECPWSDSSLVLRVLVRRQILERAVMEGNSSVLYQRGEQCRTTDVPCLGAHSTGGSRKASMTATLCTEVCGLGLGQVREGRSVEHASTSSL